MKVAVLGGGLIGLSSAHALSRDGHEVVVIERDTVGGGATPGNAGWVCQSQVAPLAAPGMLRHSAGMLLKPTSALYIAPRLDRDLTRFMLAFAKRCTTKAQSASTAALVELGEQVDADYVQLEEELGASLRQSNGVLECFVDEHHARTAHERWSQLPRVSGTGPGPLLDAAALSALEPILSGEITAGFILAQDSHLDPTLLAEALRSQLQRVGVAFLDLAGECTLLRSGATVTGVRTDSVGDVCADQVVLAAGAGSAPYLRELGVRVPLVAGTGYSFTVRPQTQPSRPIHLEDAHVATTPLGGALRIAGTMEISGRTSGIDQRRVDAIVRAASGCLRGIDWDARTDVWGGPRPVTSDGMPLLGRPRGVEACVIATGHGMYGVTLAPTTGRIVAEIVAGASGPPALSPSR